MGNTVRLRHLADVNPPTPSFDAVADDELVTFMPLETVWADSRLDTSRVRPKREVSVGYVRFAAGDILSPKVTPTFQAGRSALIGALPRGVGAASTEVHVVRVRSDKVDPRFVWFSLMTKSFLSEGMSRFQGVAGLQRVPEEFLKDLRLPSMEVEKSSRIADFLDDQVARIDRVLADRRLQTAMWENSFLAMIAEVLVGSRSLVEPRVRVAPWLGPMPLSWGFAPVSALYRVQLGKMLNPERASGPNLKPYLRNANVHWFEISTEDVAQMSFEPMELARYRLEPGDLVVCEGGAGVAEAGMWRGEIAECYYQKSLHRVRATGHLPAEWLMYWLRLAKSAGALESEGNLATIPHLTAEQFKEWRIPVPPSGYDGVGVLERGRANLDNARSLLMASVARLDELKHSLITAAVTGDFEVSTADGSQVPVG